MQDTSVLIVEDEAIIAADLAAKLATLGYRVAGITSRGEDAVELAHTLHPSVVLMDIRLKGAIDGIEAADAVRRLLDLPVIFLTAHSDDATLSRAMLSEPFGYLLKPFEEREVATAIELALYKHQAERQLREQREWLRVTLASIGDAVITCDSEARTSYLNPVAESLTGWSSAEATGRPIAEIFPLFDEMSQQPTEGPVSYVLREGKTKILANHTALRTRDGRLIPIEDSAAPIRDAEGRVIGVVLVFHDVTEKRRAQEALQASNAELAGANEELLAQSEELIRAREAADAATRAKSQFLANMSHELRTPMTGVIGMLDLVLMGSLAPEQRDCIVSAHGAAHSMVRIVNDILDMTKIEAGKLSFQEKPFSPGQCARESYDILLPAAKRKKLEFEIQVAEDVPELVVGDQTRISQVLTNLAGNAVKFTEKGKIGITVTCGAASDGKRLISFTVTDTGIGIPEAKKGLLFRQFSQVDASHSRRYGGAGLGLAISCEIAERMGGSIRCESEEGKGSSFCFQVPLADAGGVVKTGAADPAPGGPVPGAGEAGGRRLLLAEDDPTIRKTLQAMLGRYNYAVACAENGRVALEMLEREAYDLVLMDVQMPVLDGLEATALLRRKEEGTGAHLPIIAITAHALKEDRDNCLAAGMDAYISKPIDFKATLRLIAEMIERGR